MHSSPALGWSTKLYGLARYNLLAMNKQQIADTQRRLEERRGYRNERRKYHSPEEASLFRGKSNPESDAKSYLRPGKLYLRSLNPKSHKNYYTIDTDMDRLEGSLLRDNRRDKNTEKLPPIRRLKLETIPKNDCQSQRGHYRNPTCSSELHFEGRKHKLRNYDPKRICSVNCISKEDKVKSRKAPRQSRSKLQSRNCSIILEEYLSNEAKLRYPSSQLQTYLSRMKQKQEDRRKEREDEEGEELYFHTYFGLQPEFYKLQTDYVVQMYDQGKQISSMDNYRPNAVPAIPYKEDLAQFIEDYGSIGKEISIEKLSREDNFLVEYTPTELYFGQMEGDEREGLGVLISEKYCFEGLFRDNEKGKGTEVSASGLYRGQFHRGKKEGNGEFEWINGEYYVGEWKDGHRHGQGVWTNCRGDSYNGDWLGGRGEGHGIYVSEGREYHGDFLDFKKDGWGREKLPNGDYYEGGFKNSLPEGKGVYVWSSGTRYEGQFSHGFRNGKGVMSTLDGYVYNGEFVDEKPEGLCEVATPSGDSYQGYLKEGKKNGRGLLVVGEGQQTLDGYWQNDKFLSQAGSG